MSLSLAELANRLGCEFRGDGERIIGTVAPLAKATADAVSFLSDTRHRVHLATTAAGAVIVKPADASEAQAALILSDNPYACYARAASILHPPQAVVAGMQPSAVVASDAQVDSSAQICANAVIESGAIIGAYSYIGSGSVIGSHAEIGADCHIAANVTINAGCRLADRVIVHSGTVIGADGFGFANDDGRWVKIPQIGAVTIGNDVEIGANTTIDRGALDDTVIEEGVKLDNQIQVAHNVRIGAHTAIAGCVGIAGSAIIGRHCTIGGAAVILGHLTISDDVHITAMSFVRNSINESGAYSSGTPLETNQKWHRNFVRMKQLDDMARRLKILEKRLEDQD